jgi:Zn-dependent oligopeptidase
VDSLNESIRTINAQNNKAKETLTENIEELKKDSAIKHSEYTKKLTKANQLVERYKKVANKAVVKYIDSQAIRLGVTSNEIKNRLSEGFSFEDIDTVCEELQAYKLNISKLPFDISKTKNVRMKVTESVEPIKPANRFSDEIDDQLRSLAGL